jgi:hypothetical protein
VLITHLFTNLLLSSIFAAASILGYRMPKCMLQVFSLRLASCESYPISVYGIFAVRDDLEPLRNLIFNCPRDSAVTIEQVIKACFVSRMVDS